MANPISQKQLNTVVVQLAQFKIKVQDYFKAAQDQIFRGAVYTGNQAAIKAQADQAEADLNQAMVVLDTAVASGSYQGHIITAEDVSNLLSSIRGSLEKYQAAVKAWNDSSPVAVAFTVVSRMFNTAIETLISIQEGFAGAVQTGAKWIPWIPWLIVGAFVVPFALRVWSKKRREGSEAAMDYAAGSIESGRAATGRAARDTAVLAAKAAVI